MRQQKVNIILGLQEQLEKAEIFISWGSQNVMKYIWREENEIIFSHKLKFGDFKGTIVHKNDFKMCCHDLKFSGPHLEWFINKK